MFSKTGYMLIVTKCPYSFNVNCDKKDHYHPYTPTQYVQGIWPNDPRLRLRQGWDVTNQHCTLWSCPVRIVAIQHPRQNAVGCRLAQNLGHMIWLRALLFRKWLEISRFQDGGLIGCNQGRLLCFGVQYYLLNITGYWSVYHMPV